MTHDTPSALLTVQQLAERLSVSESAVRSMVYRRQIPFVRVGAKRVRFDPAAIDAWLEEQRVEVAS